MTGTFELSGFPRPDGTAGCRNHLLVLPTVVCAGLAARQIAGATATAITHQHGCDHVGDDASQVRRVFAGLATNPNVAGCLLVGLGCETIQGQPLLDAVPASLRNIGYLGIQQCGGSAGAVADGQAALRELEARIGSQARQPVPSDCLVLGIAAGTGNATGALIDALTGQAHASGSRVIAAFPGGVSVLPGSLADAARLRYGERPQSGAAVAVMTSSGPGAEQHTGLAAAGAQIIVSIRGPRQAPIGFPICPVVSVSTDSPTYAALADDFDIDGSAADTEPLATRIWSHALSAFGGQQTAAERRGATEFALQRVSRST
jgi:altronate dehydratase large subunit